MEPKGLTDEQFLKLKQGDLIKLLCYGKHFTEKVFKIVNIADFSGFGRKIILDDLRFSRVFYAEDICMVEAKDAEN